ncbi:MAG TPA: hypothetical protein VEU33_37200 [Archangium sp.]|nr:hypothetical protein [Archangium sp.]
MANRSHLTLVDLAYGDVWAALSGAIVGAGLMWRLRAEGNMMERLRADLPGPA